jgi:hypothetical protein
LPDSQTLRVQFTPDECHFVLIILILGADMTTSASESPRHYAIKEEIRQTCEQLSVEATTEVAGKGWRADVLVATESLPIAFEVQTSPQTLKKTIERQERYLRHDVTGCWLFLKPVTGLNDERPDLPLFYVSEDEQGEFLVSLGGRRDVKLRQFIAEYVQGRIRFCPDAVSSREQAIHLAFYEMKCWKCGRINHPFWLKEGFKSACNADVHRAETLWGSDRSEFRPEILAVAEGFAARNGENELALPVIRSRRSKRVGFEYMSFGCKYCDSIFGDWFIHEAEIEVQYGLGVVAQCDAMIDVGEIFTRPIPHWCYPGLGTFCVQSAPPFEQRATRSC